eukprot:GFKZ01000413.1.p1 GENE.GFKZ01000413.1~~GFKZ01000413.1.p1  ORF type:complete len:972 (-),score=132.05 GFKZ01000413.1:951-3866(-)
MHLSPLSFTLFSRFVLYILFLPTETTAECTLHLPTPPAVPPSPIPAVPSATPVSRILGGLQPPAPTFDNIVVLLDPQNQIQCSGSLLSAFWILTSAQCLVTPQWIALVSPLTADPDNEPPVPIETAIRHPSWDRPHNIPRGDLQLVRLATPAFNQSTAPRPNQSSAPSPTPPRETQTFDGEANTIEQTQAPAFNVMRVNTNPDFGMNDTRYLRVKGFGLTARSEPLTGETRDLKFADLKISPCGAGGNDGRRRLCTSPNEECGPCWGDTGAPLYDVDASGTVSVQVGVVTFGLQALLFDAEEACTSGQRPVVYTAVAEHIDWIREVISQEELEEVFIPRDGIGSVDLAPDEGLSTAARVSIIVVATLSLLGLIAAVLITCGLKSVRKRRKQWIEGLRREESFVKGGEIDAAIADPFEGIREDHQAARLSINSLSKAAVKSATEFSAKSIGAIRALIKQIDEEEMMDEPRFVMDNAPQWLPDAWERLFSAPSKQELSQIHKIPTQRVVDDVLEGTEKSVEPSLDSVAFKSARDEVNLELAWKKLEIQTSMRNLSEAGAITDGQNDSNSQLPSCKYNSGNNLSLSSSRKGGREGSLSGILGSQEIRKPDAIKADAHLAAFASIDAESEHVAEETLVDASALQALALSKRPKGFSTIWKKFASVGGTSQDSGPSQGYQGSSHKEVCGSTTHRTTSQKQPNCRIGGEAPDHNRNHSAVEPNRDCREEESLAGVVFHPTLGALAANSQNADIPMFRIADGFSGRSASGFSGAKVTPDSSRQNSMKIDYFSEDYSLTDSDSDGDGFEPFEEYASVRRYTEDRTEFPSSLSVNLSSRIGQKRSFEKLMTRKSLTDSEPEGDGVHPRPISNKRGREGRTNVNETNTPGQGQRELPETLNYEGSVNVEAEGLRGTEGNASSDYLPRSRAVPPWNAGNSHDTEHPDHVSVEMLRKMWNEMVFRDFQPDKDSLLYPDRHLDP